MREHLKFRFGELWASPWLRSSFFQKMYDFLNFLFCDLLFVEVEGVLNDVAYVMS